MANEKNYYEVLGVEPDAEPTIIKRRYRQLVREFHPDIAADRDKAHEKMLSINEAWTVLSDPAGRARYDRGRAPSVTARQNPATSSPGSAGTAGRTRVDGWVGGGVGAPAGPRTARGPASAGPARSARSSSSRGSNSRTRMLTMVFEAAELYFFQGLADEAIEVCNRVMKVDPTNAEAPALLGDIYAEQGRKDVAISMYEKAVQNQPQNMLYRQKLAALTGTTPPGTAPATPYRSSGSAQGRSNPGGRSSMSTGQRPTGQRSSSPRSAGQPSAARAPLGGRATANRTRAQTEMRTKVGIVLIALAIALILGGSFSSDPGSPSLPALPSANSLSSAIIATTAIGAVLIGIALPLLELVGRFGEVLPRAPRWTGLPLLLVTLVAGIFYFPAAFIVLIVAAVVRSELDRSLLVVLLASICWASTMALHVPEDQTVSVLTDAVLWWGGRLICPLMTIGWAMGSQVRKP